MPSQTVLAIDIGGTKMAAAVVDEHGEVLASDRRPTLRTADPEALFTSLVSLCDGVVRQTDAAATSVPLSPRRRPQGKAEASRRPSPGAAPAAIGVGCGGPMRYPAGLVSPLNIPAWRDFPLRDRLGEHFGVPCIVDNDAKALALGEQWRGAGRGSRNVLGMVVSTGVGGGIILDGQLLHGAAGNAGHVGHIVVWPDGPPCACGARGCVEAIASGTGLARRLRIALTNGPDTGVDPAWLATHPGAVASTPLRSDATAADIAAAARHGDALACELFRSAGEGTGRGIASAAALLDLERVIIGGSIALKAWDLLGPPLQAELTRSARLDFTRNLTVLQAGLGDDAGLLGAARLALDLIDG